MAMFKKNSGKNYADPAVSQLKELGAQLGNVLASGAIATKSIAHAALATEGYSEGDARNLEMASQELRSTLSSICQDVGMGDVTMAQEEAAVVAGLVAGDPASFFTRQSRKETSTDTYRVMESLGTEDGALDRNVICMVVDASDDASVTAGAAMYIYDADLDTWTKISEVESMDLNLTWEALLNKPTSSVAAIDNAVAKAHVHANKAVLDDLADDGAGVLKYKGAYVGAALTAVEW